MTEFDHSWLLFGCSSHKLFLQFLLAGKKISAPVQLEIRSRKASTVFQVFSQTNVGGWKYRHSVLIGTPLYLKASEWSEYKERERTGELSQNVRQECDEKELFAVFPSLFLPQRKEEKEMEGIWTGVELSTISFWQCFFYIPGERHLWVFSKWNWMDIQFFKIG